MNCTKIDAKWIVYFDGKANPSERREVEAHLASCSSCRQRAEEYRAMWDLLDEMPQILPSPSFDAAVRARAAAEPRRGLWAWLVPSPRLAFAVSMLLVLSVWIASRPVAPSPGRELRPLPHGAGERRSRFPGGQRSASARKLRRGLELRCAQRPARTIGRGVAAIGAAAFSYVNAAVEDLREMTRQFKFAAKLALPALLLGRLGGGHGARGTRRRRASSASSSARSSAS